MSPILDCPLALQIKRRENFAKKVKKEERKNRDQ
jgi:hypothetical protein